MEELPTITISEECAEAGFDIPPYPAILQITSKNSKNVVGKYNLYK